MRSSNGGSGDIAAHLRQFFLRGGNPLTLGLIAACVVSWFCGAILGAGNPFQFFVFSTQTWPVPLIWTAITWPIVENGNPLFVLMALFWLFTIGGSLERSWGTRTFAVFFAATTLLTAVGVWVGAHLLHTISGMAGVWLAVAPVTIAWCLLNRRETVMLSFFIPVPAIWIAWITVAMVWYLMGPPLLGIFALSGCAGAWWYVTKGRSGGGRGSLFGGLKNNGTTANTNTRFRNFDHEVRGDRADTGRSKMDLLGRMRDEQERRRRDKQLEDMFRRSGYDTDEQDKRDTP